MAIKLNKNADNIQCYKAFAFRLQKGNSYCVESQKCNSHDSRGYHVYLVMRNNVQTEMWQRICDTYWRITI